MSMTKKEQRELESLRREVASLKLALEGRKPSDVFFLAGDRVRGAPFFLPEHEPLFIGGVQARLTESGWVEIHADDVLTVLPQASNAIKIHAERKWRPAFLPEKKKEDAP